MKKTITLITFALLLLVAGCSSSNEYGAPDDVAALVADWGEAVNRADGSVIELYQPDGYHVYGDQRIEHDELLAHLQVPGFTGEMITDPLLVVNEEDRRYVVVCGARSNGPNGFSAESAINFEIVRTADDGLKVVQTAWLYQHDL